VHSLVSRIEGLSGRPRRVEDANDETERETKDDDGGGGLGLGLTDEPDEPATRTGEGRAGLSDQKSDKHQSGLGVSGLDKMPHGLDEGEGAEEEVIILMRITRIILLVREERERERSRGEWIY
jgi:hypothetical protein